ncbi:hypothetical protein GGR50DRAFT_696874 [Xylaria sp. CBS 124048]|nr:hypothetical protein GGR50DRAFT_696874 [Xylaria sp. CBS 124048]
MERYRVSLLAATSVFLALDTLVVCARVYVRTKVVRGFGWDDAALCLTHVGYIISICLGYAAIHYGYAATDHQPWYDAKKATMFTYGNQTTLYISAGLVKWAVALVLLRINVGKGIRNVLIGSIFVVGIWTIITVVFASGICATGGSSNWAGSSKCSDVGYFRTISNIFIDYFYALVPVFMLRGSQMKTRLKLIAIILLGLGIFASTATIVKLVILVRLNDATGSVEAGLHFDLLLWADIELGLAIMAASAAALRPLLRHVSILDNSGQRSSTLEDTTNTGPYHELRPKRYTTTTTTAGESVTRPKTESGNAARMTDDDLFQAL